MKKTLITVALTTVVVLTLTALASSTIMYSFGGAAPTEAYRDRSSDAAGLGGGNDDVADGKGSGLARAATGSAHRNCSSLEKKWIFPSVKSEVRVQPRLGSSLGGFFEGGGLVGLFP